MPSRMAFNLLTPIGRHNFHWARSYKAAKINWKDVLRDTLLPLVCRFSTHKPYVPDPNYEPHIQACRRCGNYLAELPRHNVPGVDPAIVRLLNSKPSAKVDPSEPTTRIH